MKLFEFFGHQDLNFHRQHPDDTGNANRDEEKENLTNEVFFHILDHDRLHKKHFFNVAKHVKEHNKADGHDPKVWMEMVQDGCVDFFHQHKMKGDIKEIFSKDLRQELCQRLADHFHKDIAEDKYLLGK